MRETWWDKLVNWAWIALLASAGSVAPGIFISTLLQITTAYLTIAASVFIISLCILVVDNMMRKPWER